MSAARKERTKQRSPAPYTSSRSRSSTPSSDSFSTGNSYSRSHGYSDFRDDYPSEQDNRSSSYNRDREYSYRDRERDRDYYSREDRAYSREDRGYDSYSRDPYRNDEYYNRGSSYSRDRDRDRYYDSPKYSSSNSSRYNDRGYSKNSRNQDSDVLSFLDDYSREKFHNNPLQQVKMFERQLKQNTIHKNDNIFDDERVNSTISFMLDRSFPGEQYIPFCRDTKLQSYRIEISPKADLTFSTMTFLQHEKKIYMFDAFYILTHEPLQEMTPFYFLRNGETYNATLIEEDITDYYDLKSLEATHKYLFDYILGHKDWLKRSEFEGNDACRLFHFFPKFIEIELKDKTVAFEDLRIANSDNPVDELITIVEDSPPLHLSKVNDILTDQSENILSIIKELKYNHPKDWKQKLRDYLLNRVITTEYSGFYSAFRVDGINFEKNPESKVMRERSREEVLSPREHLKREYGVFAVDVEQPLLYHQHIQYTKSSALGGYQTVERGATEFIYFVPQFCWTSGVNCDICQIAVILQSVTHHIRLMTSLYEFDKILGFKIDDKVMLRQALTHPSFTDAFGVYADLVRAAYNRVASSKTVFFGEETRKKQFKKRRDNILSTMQKSSVKQGEVFQSIENNQRLEFLGDAVLEFIVTSHVFLEFPDKQEGELTIFRAGLVNNRLLCYMGENMGLDEFVLRAPHRVLEEGTGWQYMIADCFEALMGVIYLDKGLEAARIFLAKLLFPSIHETQFLNSWLTQKLSPVQVTELSQQQKEQYKSLTKVLEFQDVTGIQFNNELLLLQAFTHPSVANGFDVIGLGSNQRLEFLGDSVLQFLTSRFLFANFPEHQEGQLTLLRNTLVNNNTLSIVSEELGFSEFVRHMPSDNLANSRQAQKGMLADTFEALIGALYVDRDLDTADAFLQVVLYPRTDVAIENRDWLDAKTKFQYVLSFVSVGKALPNYEILSEVGPPHAKIFKVGAYFRGEMLGIGKGGSRSVAEQAAAQNALDTHFVDTLKTLYQSIAN